MPRVLLNRLFDAKDQPTPRFAFRGTINWMRAIALLVDTGFSGPELTKQMSEVQRRSPNSKADTVTLENMLMAYHQHVSLTSFSRGQGDPYDVCRSAIVAWYYSVYFSVSAMVAACSGSSQETHAATAKAWQYDLVRSGVIPDPFGMHLSSLVKKDVDAEAKRYRNELVGDLTVSPTDLDEAKAAAVSYLTGTAGFEKWKVEQRVKETPAFKALGKSNFQTKPARALRDQGLGQAYVNFLIQAFRYRGKANYRDSIFLTYGDDFSSELTQFIQDLHKVSEAFQKMTAHYIDRRLRKHLWSEFLQDVHLNGRLSVSPSYLGV